MNYFDSRNFRFALGRWACCNHNSVWAGEAIGGVGQGLIGEFSVPCVSPSRCGAENKVHFVSPHWHGAENGIRSISPQGNAFLAALEGPEERQEFRATKNLFSVLRRIAGFVALRYGRKPGSTSRRLPI